MYSISSQWDTLKTVCVGSVYPPEVFSFIKDKTLRNHFETLVTETAEDLDNLAVYLNKQFGIKVLRPQLEQDLDAYRIDNGFMAPPIAARDFMCMIDDVMYYPGIGNKNYLLNSYDKSVSTWEEHQWKDQKVYNRKVRFFDSIFAHILDQGNNVVASPLDYFNSSFIARLPNTLIVGTQDTNDDRVAIKKTWQQMFPDKTIFVKDTEGHADATFCPVNENLIITAYEDIDYSDMLPNAEILHVPAEVTFLGDEFANAIHLAENKWFLEGMEHNQQLVDTVDHYFSNWVGQVDETAFMINILMIDSKNAVVNSDNKEVRQAMQKHGVELHVVPFKHRFFWDTGTHCLTQDLHRDNNSKKFNKNY